MAAQQVSDALRNAWADGKYDSRNHGMQRLSDDDVREIRRLLKAGFLQRVIADRFGINQRTVSDIKRGYRRSGVSSNG